MLAQMHKHTLTLCLDCMWVLPINILLAKTSHKVQQSDQMVANSILSM
jgi:hypothetical protein